MKTASTDSMPPRSDAPSRWYILGAGSLGCLWGAYLAAAGQPVTLILRDARRRARYLAGEGLCCDTDQGPWRRQPEAISAAPLSGRQQLLVCTKAYDALSALAPVAARLEPGSSLILFQNGMGAQQAVADAYPQHRVYAASTTEGAYLRAPFAVVHAGRGQTWLGPLNRTAEAAGAAPLAPLLQLPLATAYEPAIEQRLWQKLSINAAINGLTALHDCVNGKLAEHPPYRRQVKALCLETEQVMSAQGYPPSQPLLETALAVARATAANRSSMLQDLRAGRRTEIDYINGFLCRQAESLGIATPTHRWLLEAVHNLESQQEECSHG